MLVAAFSVASLAQVSSQETAGAAYSAEQVLERTLHRADGTNVSEQREVTKIYRDSRGRSRTEGPHIIDISDPVGGYLYRLEGAPSQA